MTLPPFRIELLDRHDRHGFDCHNTDLNTYFRERAGQDMRRHVAFCYVVVHSETGQVAGFYTLAACGVALNDLPEFLAKKLPRYPSVPAVRIGRLAADGRFQEKGLGAALLFDAVSRTKRSGVAAFAVIVDAKDRQSESFYEHHGFQPFAAQPLMLLLPIGAPLAPRRRAGLKSH